MKELIDNRKLYTDYLNEHIDNVNQVWHDFKMTAELHNWKYPTLDDKDIFSKVDSLVCKHDSSKWSPEEFEAYRCNFYPCSWEKEVPLNKVFLEAWEHHWKLNPHHWEFWVVKGTHGTVCRDMEISYIYEMLCDWTAMSYKFKDTPFSYYCKNRDAIHLSAKTQNEIFRLLPYFSTVAELHNNKQGE